MHTRHLARHNFLLGGNYTIVFLFHIHIFSSQVQAYSQSKIMLARCKTYLSYGLKSYSDSPLAYPFRLHYSITNLNAILGKASTGQGLPQSTSRSSRLNKCVQAQDLPKQGSTCKAQNRTKGGDLAKNVLQNRNPARSEKGILIHSQTHAQPPYPPRPEPGPGKVCRGKVH